MSSGSTTVAFSHQTNAPKKRGINEVLAGTFAGVVGTACGHPLDLIKVRLQTQLKSSAAPVYKGMLHCGQTIIKEEGLGALFRGMASPMVALTLLNALSFGTYGSIKDYLQKDWNNGAPLHSGHFFFAGAVVGVLSTPVSTPFEMVKVRLQLDNVQGRRFSGSLHCAKELVKNYGISSLGTGMLVNGWREVLFCTIYFGVYENVKARLKKTFKETTGSERELLAILLSGGLSGMISWFTTFPLDSLKSNIQGQPLENLRTPQRASALKLVVNRFKQVGIKGFYSGVYPAVVRACIVSSTRFTSFEFALQTLAKLDI